MKKTILPLVLILSFFSFSVFADDYDSYDSYDSYDNYDYSSYDTYDVYDVYDTYDSSYTSSYSPSYGGSYNSWSYSNNTKKSSPSLSCPTYNTPTAKEGCTTTWSVGVNGCTYPTQICKKVETPKCPTHSKPTYGKGCTQTWQSDSQGCYYLSETCSAVQEPAKNTCAGKHSLPTYSKWCTGTWHQDSEGCYYLTQDCSQSSTNSSTTYYKNSSRDDKNYRYDPNTNTYYYYNQYGSTSYVPYSYYYAGKRWYVSPGQPSAIYVHGQKKVNTDDTCSNTPVQICGKKKVDISDYTQFGTKDVEKYKEITYESECELKSNDAEYLHPGECSNYDACPLYKVTPKTWCTTTRKTDSSGCQYPKQVCSSAQNTTTSSLKKTTTPSSQSGNSSYWFTPVLK